MIIRNNNKKRKFRKKFIANALLISFYVLLTAGLLVFGISHMISKAAISNYSESEETPWYEDLKEPIVVQVPKDTKEQTREEVEIAFLKEKLNETNSELKKLEGKAEELEKAKKEIKKLEKEIKKQEEKQEEQSSSYGSVTAEEVSMLEHLCEGEAGDQNDECQQAVVSVVLNRVKHRNYPNSIEGVIFQRGQYACTWDGNYNRTPSERVKQNVQAVLSGEGIYVPENVIYQAQFTQGSGIWRQIGTETFCYA